jgi:hypothetical protein
VVKRAVSSYELNEHEKIVLFCDVLAGVVGLRDWW